MSAPAPAGMVPVRIDLPATLAEPSVLVWWPAARLPEVGQRFTVYTQTGRREVGVESVGWEILAAPVVTSPPVTLVVRCGS